MNRIRGTLLVSFVTSALVVWTAISPQRVAASEDHGYCDDPGVCNEEADCGTSCWRPNVLDDLITCGDYDGGMDNGYCLYEPEDGWPTNADPDEYGVCSSIQFLEGTGLTRLNDLNVGWVRIDLSWSLVQPTTPVDQTTDFDFSAAYDWIESSVNAGHKVYMSLHDPPSWAAACEYCKPYSMTEWYWFVRRSIEEMDFGSDVAFGIWNEPDYGNHLYGADPYDYIDIFEAAADARYDADPSARLGAFDMGGADASLNTSWLSTAWNNGVSAAMESQDIVAVHYYPSTDEVPYDRGYLETLVQDADAIVDREIWVTETGAITPNTDQSSAMMVGTIVAEFNARTTAHWTKLFVYRLQTGGSGDDESLCYSGWSPRPAFYMYQSRIPH